MQKNKSAFAIFEKGHNFDCTSSIVYSNKRNKGHSISSLVHEKKHDIILNMLTKTMKYLSKSYN